MSLNIPLLRSSFETVKPIATEVVSQFYETLFASYPESRVLFRNADMEKQKKILIGALVRVVEGLDNLESLGGYLRALGGRHVAYGIKEEHYAMVAKCLILTFKKFFKEQWTSELEDQWILAIGFIADNMLEGAAIISVQSLPPNTPPRMGESSTELSQVARQIARTILMKALELEIDAETMKVARKRAAHILTQAIREEGEILHNQFESAQKRVA